MLVSILIFALVLGWIILFHELGHFLAAKACNIYVERFSIGFPPRLFGFQWGETDYCVGALPVGGYVKMAGQEDVPLSEEEIQKQYSQVPKERWFNNRPIWQRFIVIAAGPSMNLLLGILLYGIVALVGAFVPESTVDNRIGAIDPDSPATRAPLYRSTSPETAPDYSKEPDAIGWKTGDRILTIDGETVKNISDVAIMAALGEGRTHDVVIERTQPDGTLIRYHSLIKPEVFADEHHARFGVAPFITALIERAEDGMPAQRHGIESGDIITRANGMIVDNATLTDLVEHTTDGNKITLDILRGNQTPTVTLTPEVEGRFTGVKFAPPLQWVKFLSPDATLKVGQVSPEFTESTGLRRRDVITAVEGQEATPALLRHLSRERPTAPLKVTVNRPARLFGLLGKAQTLTLDLSAAQILQGITGVDDQAAPEVAAVTPEVEKEIGLKPRDMVIRVDGELATVARLREIEDARPGGSVHLAVLRFAIWGGLLRPESREEVTLPIARVGVIGLVWGEKMVFYRVPVPQVVPEAFRKGFQAVRWSIQTVAQLLTGELSPRELGGPLMIYHATSLAAQEGYSWLLEITAFISVSLFVLNVLPLPVLDGGLLLFLLIEKVRRKPLELWLAERIQKVGLALIVCLMVYVTYNDILRMISDLVP